MSRANLIFASLILLLGAEVSARAQEAPERTSLLKSGLLPPGARLGYSAKFLLLERPFVQQELKLTPAQLANLKKLQGELDVRLKKQNEEGKEQLRELRKQGDAQAYEAALEEQTQRERADFRLLTSKREEPLLKALDRRQITRLEQIQLQFESFMAFTRPDVQQRLGLSFLQVEAIDEIIAEGKDTVTRSAEVPTGVVPPGRLDAEQKKALLESKAGKAQIKKTTEAVVDARRSVMQKIGRQLTRKQRAAYDAMLGEPFDPSKPKPEVKAPEAKPSEAPEEKGTQPRE
jgi:Spy/CpxP family protein refolding chaperone